MNVRTRTVPWLLAGCSMVALACSGARPGPTARRLTGAQTRTPAVVSPLLERRLDDLAQRLSRDGVVFEGVAASGFITHGTFVVTPIEMAAGSCWSIVAIASVGIQDLDAHLFDPDGRIVAQDVETDPHPTVQICASEPRRLYHVIETYVGEGAQGDGNGAYAIGVFRSDRATFERVARALGGRPGTALGSGAHATGAEQRVIEFRAGLAQRGFQPQRDVLRGSFGAPGNVRYPLEVTPERCYALGAIGGDGIGDVDLRVFSASGAEVARDVRAERDAFVQFCPRVTETVEVEVGVRQGQGEVLFETLTGDAAELGGANALWLGERLEWHASAVELGESIETARARMHAAGYEPTGVPVRVVFSPGEVREQELSVGGGRCSAIVVVSGRGVGSIRFDVVTATGDVAARSERVGAASAAALCASTLQTVRVRMAVETGAGEAAVQAYTGGEAPAWAATLDAHVAARVLTQRTALLAQGWSERGVPQRVRLDAGAAHGVSVPVAPRRCVNVLVSADGVNQWVEIRRRDARGAIAARTRTMGTGSLERCSDHSESAAVEVSVDARGPAQSNVTVEIFERDDGSQTGSSAPARAGALR